MDSNTLRSRFLSYFEARDHRVVPSASLVPTNDPTLLFTNAGMVPFKEVFLGREKRDYQRAASSQRCVRAGGKHNDLENVGYTARHHTFFEMLGNFSFGDYFKREAIVYAWEFLTSEEWLGLPADKLLATVYESDDEAYAVWRDDIGLPEARILRIGDKPDGGSDNFWQMGDTGPCGPCSEIFFDHGPDVPGGPPGTPEEDGDRFIEIWNLVFMQYDRAADGTLTPLPAPSVDTGMGLERLAAVLQGKHSNYDTDAFQRLMAAAAEVLGVPQDNAASLKVIADHIRATSFLICDGVLPGNEGRGYVLRRIIRRAARHGHKLGARSPFLHRLVAPLGEVMGEAYGELATMREQLERTIHGEEEAFAQMLDRGLKLLDEQLQQHTGKILPGEVAFHLYDTHGFPVDLTADILRERGMHVDMEGFEASMAEQRSRARAASRFEGDYGQLPEDLAPSEFTGYEALEHGAVVQAILIDGQPAETLEAGQGGQAVVFLDRTPFYGEAGGQVGDTGVISAPGTRFEVRDTQALRAATPGHIGELAEGRLRVGDHVKAEIDADRRGQVVRNHSATHLLHAALRKVLGTHVAQKGSLVAPERLRFDFSHTQPVSAEELTRIEDEVNAQIRANVAAETDVCAYQEAIDRGAIAMFGEKYGDTVRVLALGDYSVELCGGTHVARTGDIGAFRIVHEGGVSAGVRRIEAITGEAVIRHMRDTESRLREAAELLRATPDDLVSKLQGLVTRNRETERALQQARDKLAQGTGGDLLAQAKEIAGVNLLASRVEIDDAGALRGMMDKLKERLGSGVIVLGAEKDGKAVLIAGVTKDLTDKLSAGALIKEIAAQVGGKGGGRPDMAQAGGPQPEHLDVALGKAADWVAAQLEG
ncbi:alanine--tRNA ligase [Algiphilus aromaticivorans]|uniref:alanine--tRNA ligase n=1 Tax=Algiphilus aromaticivorans TaxID=382454 RepID=UPI0005C21400|nr:alanine--tRNA ligase [Algiphilus aromaticivorans]